MKRRLTLDEVNGTSKGTSFAGYVSLSEEERDKLLAEALHGREVERYQYALNAFNYQQILDSEEMKSLPEEWPANIVAWQRCTRDEIASNASEHLHEQIYALQHRDRLRHLLTTELVELAKVEKYHAQIIVCIPPERLEKALQLAREIRIKREGLQP